MMELTTPWNRIEAVKLSTSTIYTNKSPTLFATSSFSSKKVHKPFFSVPYYHTLHHLRIMKPCFIIQAKGKNPSSEPILRPTIVEEVSMEDDDLIFDDFDDDDGRLLDDDDELQDGYLEEDVEPFAGDGEGRGGVSLAGTSWDKEALAIAEEVALSFEGDLGIYAFKTLLNSTIRVRVEKLFNKSGSPTIDDIEAFSIAYRKRLDEGELAGSIPKNIALEVSSPGVERVVRIPQDLNRFKDRPMYVKYLSEVEDIGTSTEKDGVFRLVSFDLETNTCTWGLADVRVNKEKVGKGRPLSKKRKEWRLETTFDSLRLVRLYSGN